MQSSDGRSALCPLRWNGCSTLSEWLRMAGKVKITLLKPATQQDAGGEIVGEPVPWRSFWATKTESGGRENLFASRIVHEGAAVLTIPYVAGPDGRTAAVTSSMLVEINGRRRPIEYVYEEGFRRKLHIMINLSDLEYEGGY